LGYIYDIVIPRDKEGKQITMWKLIAKNGFPTRTRRFCCRFLKELPDNGNQYLVFGVRWAESINRQDTRKVNEVHTQNKNKRFVTNDENSMSRHLTETCETKNSINLNPIIDWSEQDVWDYIHENNLPYNPLYNKGFKRIGYIGCPMNSKRKQDLDDLPKYANLYKKAGGRYLSTRTVKTMDAEQYFNWWLSGKKSSAARQIQSKELF